MATTCWPSSSALGSPKVAVGRLVAPLSWISATSFAVSTPTTLAGNVPCPETLTRIEVAPRTTWLLVKTSPEEVNMIPVPAPRGRLDDEPGTYDVRTKLLTSTMAGVTCAAAEAAPEPCDGVAPWEVDGGRVGNAPGGKAPPRRGDTTG